MVTLRKFTTWGPEQNLIGEEVVPRSEREGSVICPQGIVRDEDCSGGAGCCTRIVREDEDCSSPRGPGAVRRFVRRQFLSTTALVRERRVRQRSSRRQSPHIVSTYTFVLFEHFLIKPPANRMDISAWTIFSTGFLVPEKIPASTRLAFPKWAWSLPYGFHRPVQRIGTYGFAGTVRHPTQHLRDNHLCTGQTKTPISYPRDNHDAPSVPPGS